MIGAWCFVDHYGPDDVSVTGGMDVPPHPHTGLQTVSWLFTGEIEHRDTTGAHALVRPGEVNIMTAGSGVAHSEVSTEACRTLHGVQLWTALPGHSRHVERSFTHHVPPVVDLEGAEARVLLGTLAGDTSPVPTYSPLLGAQIVMEPFTELTLEVDPSFEHGVLVDEGPVLFNDVELQPTQLGFRPTGARELRLSNPRSTPGRIMLLGGTPLSEPIMMWWNFIGRTHEEIVAYREEWQAGSERFGHVNGYEGKVDRLPAPTMPNIRLRPRMDPPTGDPSAWG